MNLRNAVTVLSFFFATTAVSAENETPLQQLARQFLAGNLPAVTAGVERELIIAEPDARLQLTNCATSPEPFWPNNARQSGSTVVGIRCPGNGGWQVFLPVRIQEWVSVQVASRPLRPGTRLAASDMKLMRVNREQLRGSPHSDSGSLIGAVTRSAVAAGQPLDDRLTCQVCKGDDVKILAELDGLQVVMAGLAEQSGNMGDRILVRNLSSRRPVQAEITAGGTVKVAF
jgi:flagellar basal body P-ring formation protein FlgA